MIIRHTASCPKNKKMSAVPSGSSFRHVIITVVCDVVKHIAQLVQFVVIKYLDGINDKLLRGNTAMLAFRLCYRIVRGWTYPVKICVHGLGLFLAQECGTETLCDILCHLADRICAYRILLCNNDCKFL